MGSFLLEIVLTTLPCPKTNCSEAMNPDIAKIISTDLGLCFFLRIEVPLQVHFWVVNTAIQDTPTYIHT